MLKEELTAGCSCWAWALSQLHEAECPSKDFQVFSFSLSLSRFTSLSPFHRDSEAERRGRPHLQHKDGANEISYRARKLYEPIFLPSQMWAGNPSSLLYLWQTLLHSQHIACTDPLESPWSLGHYSLRHLTPTWPTATSKQWLHVFQKYHSPGDNHIHFKSSVLKSVNCQHLLCEN